jgi:hypothetical protein|uniref:Uncharacterized protein n=1 Tax=Picea glauca TaxID=3330 RepID=A0A124GMG5_PICGL|nr:hypothetical protein ABT39_MTgene2428 [Picea glauca]QHR86782.1 hypothetical protein Q903MT_gene787 [Picea sitchensis]
MHHTYHLIDSHLLPAEGMTDIKGWMERIPSMLSRNGYTGLIDYHGRDTLYD